MLRGKLENIGAQLVKRVASRTNDIAGDGTSTSVVLTQAILKAGQPYLASGLNPVLIKRGMDEALEIVEKSISELSSPIETYEDTKNIAMISANNDEKIGELIADAMDKVGKNGVITISEGGTSTELVVKKGMEFGRGYVSPYFVTNTEKMICEYENVVPVLYDKKISSIDDIILILEQARKAKRPVMFMAEAIEGSALQTLVTNKVRNNLPVVAVKAPGYGERRKEFLKDIAVMCGGTFIDEDFGMSLGKIDIAQLGNIRNLTVGIDKTIMADGNGTQEAVDNRISEIENMIATTQSNFDKEDLQNRIAKLIGGVAILRVGAMTELEMKEKKDRIEDALHATKAGVLEGVVPGGGTALLRARKKLQEEIKNSEDGSPWQAGMKIVLEALIAPISQIIKNTGISPDIIIDKLYSQKDEIGYNAATGAIENMIESGVIDPTKVVRNAIKNAVSIASTLLTTRAVVALEEEDYDGSN